MVIFSYDSPYLYIVIFDEFGLMCRWHVNEHMRTRIMKIGFIEDNKRGHGKEETLKHKILIRAEISRNHNSTSKISLGRSRRNQGTCHLWMESCGCLVSKSFGITAIQILRQFLPKLSHEFGRMFLHQNSSQACQRT